MFVFLEVSLIQVKKELPQQCHSIYEIYYLPKIASDSLLTNFSREKVLFQHAELWIEAQFSFLIFPLSCKSFCRRQWFCGRAFLVLFSCCLSGLLLADICLQTRHFLTVRLSGLTVANMSHILPAESKHQRHPCSKAFLPHHDNSCPQRCCKYNQHFMSGFPVTPRKFLTSTALSVSFQDHHILHKQMLARRFVCNAIPNLVILTKIWEIQRYLAKKVPYYQNIRTRAEWVEISFTGLTSMNWDEKSLISVTLPRTSQCVHICLSVCISLLITSDLISWFQPNLTEGYL